MKSVIQGFLDRILPRRTASGLETGLAEEFGHMLPKNKSLARELAHYVTTGNGSSALLKLQALDPRELIQKYYNLSFSYSLYAYLSDARKSTAFQLFSTLEWWNAEKALRHGNVMQHPLQELLQLYPYRTDRPYWTTSIRAFMANVMAFTDQGSSTSSLLNFEFLRAMATLDGLSDAEFLGGIYEATAERYGPTFPVQTQAAPPVWLFMRNNPDSVIAGIAAARNENKVRWMADLANQNLLTIPSLQNTVIEYAASPSKVVAAGALKALPAIDSDILLGKAGDMLGSSAVAVRSAAVEIIRKVVGEKGKTLLEAHVATEKNKRIAQAIDEALQLFAIPKTPENAGATRTNESGSSYIDLFGAAVAIPPLTQQEPEGNILPSSLMQPLRTALEEKRIRDQQRYDSESKAGHSWVRKPEPEAYDPKLVDTVAKVLNGEAVSKRENQSIRRLRSDMAFHYYAGGIHDAMMKILSAPEVTLHHIVRLMVWLYSGDYRVRDIVGQTKFIPEALGLRVINGTDLRLIAQIISHYDKDYSQRERFLLISKFSPQYEPFSSFDWQDANPQLIWPFVTELFGEIDKGLGLTVGSEEGDKTTALQLLSSLPRVPQRYLARLLEMSVTGDRPSRLKARTILSAHNEITPLICGLLSGGEYGRRAATAQWLAERGDKAALPALYEAVKREKNDVARAAIISAISSLGDNISSFFADDVLLAEARKALPKLKRTLETWLPPTALPAVRWADGRPIPADIVQYWLLLSDKLNAAGGNPMLQLALDRMDKDDAAKLGLTILSAFITHDTSRPNEADANAYASANVDVRLVHDRRYRPDLTREVLFEEIKRYKLSEYLTSASEHRGILALAVRAPGADAVRLVKAFLRDHSQRTQQCKALLECLANNPSSVALQQVLAVSNRHKTPGVQKFAGELVDAVAQRQNWTRSELADRTVPTGGFDENGQMECIIADKIYTLQLDAECKIIIHNPDGKAVSSLPTPSDDGAAQQASLAKKALSNAKKEIKEVIDLQSRRLYEAMCIQRQWSGEDFANLFLAHPLMQRLLMRLVLTAHDKQGQPITQFRPLDDGSLTTVDDMSFDIAEAASVTIAHSAVMAAEARDAWIAHLADYEVKPLFPQLTRPVLTDIKGKTEGNLITDKRGFMIETYKLRTIATKLGYQRGPAEDGGSFMHYGKYFDAIGLSAVVEFTGSFLPEENIPAALTGLYFTEKRNAGVSSRAKSLSAIPPVMLCECWNDFHTIAEAGSGFDDDWEKKAYF